MQIEKAPGKAIQFQLKECVDVLHCFLSFTHSPTLAFSVCCGDSGGSSFDKHMQWELARAKILRKRGGTAGSKRWHQSNCAFSLCVLLPPGPKDRRSCGSAEEDRMQARGPKEAPQETGNYQGDHERNLRMCPCKVAHGATLKLFGCKHIQNSTSHTLRIELIDTPPQGPSLAIRQSIHSADSDSSTKGWETEVTLTMLTGG